MLSDWPSELVPQHGWGDEDSISAFKDAIPWEVSKSFVAGTARHLAGNLGLTKPGPPVGNNINHDKQLQVIMPALGYGLSFPLSEIDLLRDCVTVYCEWLTSLLPNPKQHIPRPILKDPNHYARIIINHFYYLFVPRPGQGPDVVNRQAVLCHRVLRTLQNIAQNSTSLSEDTWQTLLLFLLHINSALLSPPTIKEDAGEQLCERVLSVLFETWLLACARCFPPPPLWNALRESCQRWRHRAGLIDQWCRISQALTAKVTSFMYGPNFPRLTISEDNMNIIPENMSHDCIAQIWYRILHIIGNPVDLSRQAVISKTPAFLKYAISSELVVEPSQHPCLQALPSIFLAAMSGVSVLVNAFLGIPKGIEDPQHKIQSSLSSSHMSESKTDHSDSSKLLISGRPKCNSVLHLFGPWLFEAALINCNMTATSTYHKNDNNVPGSTGSGSSGTGNKRPLSMHGDLRKPSESTTSLEAEKLPALLPQHFQTGRAEALGALCRIFCSKKTGEEILPVYLARFYLAVKEGLRDSDEIGTPTTGDQFRKHYPQGPYSETAASILLNGCDLFRLDLEGVITLVPSFLPVLASILPEKELNPSNQIPSVVLLRRAAIHVLLSLLPLPLHFQGLVIRELGNVGNTGERVRVSQLRLQMVNQMMNGLQFETDPVNTQMLLGGLLFCVQDAALCEAMDSISQHNFGTEKDTNIMSSGASDTTSSLGGEFNSLVDDVSDVADTSTPIPSAVGMAISGPQDSAHALFVRAIYLVCHRLISSWKSDVNISLAGLELLAGLARLSLGEQETGECKCAVRWICDYIVNQCSRPPPSHSKDLHSMIVAAFHCASVWLVAHPYLLNDQECLQTVLEVIELGISGSKSKLKSGDQAQLKHEKDLKPASMRVRDAAEALLSCLLSQVGSFPSVCGAESLSSLLEEVTLLKHCNTWGGDDPITKDAACQHFRYFVTQNSIMLALLEQPLSNNQDPQPTVTALIRGPFGRAAWTMQLRHQPRHKSSAKQYMSNPGRPLPMNDIGVKHSIKPKYFPDSIDRIPSCKADKSIPTLESVIAINDKSLGDHEKLLQILSHQIAYEESVKQKMESGSSPYPDVESECAAPPLCQEFQTARLLLSHFGLLSLEALQESASSPVPSLVALDSTHGGFVKDLDVLDTTNNRTVDTVHVFYVRSGQCHAVDILDNVMSSSCVNAHFLEFLEGLGWAVNVHQHSGWTGHVSTSFSVTNPPSSTNSDSNDGSIDNHGGSLYSGKTHVLYWADALSELAFVVPCCTTTGQGGMSVLGQPLQAVGLSLDCIDQSATSISSTGGSERSDSLPPYDGEGEGGNSSLSSHTSQMSYGDARSRRFGRQTSAVTYCDDKVLVVWLESYDDYHTFPQNDLLSKTLTGLESQNWREKEYNIFIIYIHALSNGLFRIKLQGHLNKLSMAGPLVDGQVVSRRVLGTLVRQTTLNICRRRRLESDSYQPPHVRRKLRVQEMVQKYRCEMTQPEFYTHLFTSPLC